MTREELVKLREADRTAHRKYRLVQLAYCLSVALLCGVSLVFVAVVINLF